MGMRDNRLVHQCLSLRIWLAHLEVDPQ
jgi:hypothetical protein